MYPGAAQHLAALGKSKFFSSLQVGYAEKGQTAMGEQPTHISRGQLAKSSKGSGPGHREERRAGEMRRENNTLPSNKTHRFY